MLNGVFNKNFWLATAFAIGTIMAWDYFILKDIREADQISRQQQKEIKQSSALQNNVASADINKPNNSSNTIKRIEINNGKIIGSLSTEAGRLDDVSLVNYKETLDSDSKNIKLFDYKNSNNAYFFESNWASLDTKTPDSKTIWSSSSTKLTPTSPVILRWTNSDGVTFIKEISIDEEYLITVKDTIINGSNKSIELFPFAFILRHNDPNVEDLFISHEGFVGNVNNTLERVKYKDTLAKRYEYNGNSTYVGFTDKYWLTAILLDKSVPTTTRFLSFKDSDKINNYQADYKGQTFRIESNQSQQNISRVFVGPKEYDIISGYNKSLNLDRFDDTIDFGWFFFFTKPMIVFLLWIYHSIGNFGLAILLFTVIIRVVILPIAYKSYISMAKMKELQPKMKELKEANKEDMQKYNKELMALYKKEKVNPLSGCLPILLQIPIFFSIYKVIFISIELRHAPFWGWIHDMSAKDPTSLLNLFGLLNYPLPSFLQIGIWPILMGVTMFFQQKLSTTQALDNIQQKVMNMMPIILVFVLASFPVGLVIYWTWSNVISIVQQFFINRIVAKKMHIHRNKKS